MTNPGFHPEIPEATPPVITQIPVFEVGEYKFPLPEVDEATKRVTASAVLNLLMIALAASDDKKIRNVLKAARVELTDAQGKRFFPLPTD